MNGVNAAGKRVSLLCDDSEYESSRAPAAKRTTSFVEGAKRQQQQSQLPYHPRPAATATTTATTSASAASLPSIAAASLCPAAGAARPGPHPLVVAHASHSHSHSPSHSSSHSHSSARNSNSNPSSYSSRSSISTSTTTSSTHPYHSDSDSSLSRHSSIASPRYSPAVRPVPHLQRHDSCSSARSLPTPSPMTPTYPLEPLDPQGKTAINLDPGASYSFSSTPQHHYHHANPLVAGAMSSAGPVSNVPFYPSSAQGALPVSASQTNMFASFPNLQQPPFDDAYAIPAQVQYQYPTNLIDTVPAVAGLASASLASPTSLVAANPNAPIPPVDPSTAPTNASAPGSTTKAKKKYPCPHAAKFNCHDTFTTSGHAARHGKKHTGEKNILCPTCHKAFTRKDNMKQHERTHKNNRNSDSVDHSKSGTTNGHSRRTQSISSVAASTMTHKSSNSIDMELDSPLADAFDSKRSSIQRPSLARPGQYSGSNSTGSGDFKLDPLQHQRPELNRQFSGESQDGEGESPGLDALAMAATSELR